MNKKSLKITTGAMVTAIFGVLLLLNRQTGNLFQDIFLFLYPIPMVAYSALYGWKSGIPVLIAMSLLSCLYGTFTSVFYAVTQALIGLIFGGCLYHKVEMTKTLFVVMILSAAVNVLDILLLGFVAGFGLDQEIAEMQAMINSVFGQAGVVVPEQIMSVNYLKQIMIVSMVLFGAIQGFIMYEVSLLILRRLRFPVQKPKSVYLYSPPKWTGYCALLFFFSYGIWMVKPLEHELLQNIVLTVGIFSYIYLLCFGFIAIMWIFKVHFPKLKLLGFVAGFLGMFIFPFVVAVAGFIYISGK